MPFKFGRHSAFVLGDHYVFGGHAAGFKTKVAQNYTKVAPDQPVLDYKVTEYRTGAGTVKDTFVFKYDPDEGTGCMYG